MVSSLNLGPSKNLYNQMVRLHHCGLTISAPVPLFRVRPLRQRRALRKDMMPSLARALLRKRLFRSHHVLPLSVLRQPQFVRRQSGPLQASKQTALRHLYRPKTSRFPSPSLLRQEDQNRSHYQPLRRQHPLRSPRPMTRGPLTVVLRLMFASLRPLRLIRVPRPREWPRQIPPAALLLPGTRKARENEFRRRISNDWLGDFHFRRLKKAQDYKGFRASLVSLVC